MTRILFDLAGAEDRRFSPHCWKSKMALKHKGLSFDTEPCTFLEVKEKTAFANWERVPVLKDGDQAIGDSWAIAEYLEAHYPEAPSLFGSDDGKTFARFVNDYGFAVLHPNIAGATVYDIYDRIVEADKPYFKASREKGLGRPLDDFRPDRDAFVGKLRAGLAPARSLLSDRPYLTGEAPMYADYCLFGSLQWIRVCTEEDLLAPDDPVRTWRDRMLDLFDGYGASEPAAAA